MRWVIHGVLLFLLAAGTLPLVTAAVEAVMEDPGNLILPIHLLLVGLAGAVLGAMTARERRAAIIGGVVGTIAAVLADLAWLVAIAG